MKRLIYGLITVLAMTALPQQASACTCSFTSAHEYYLRAEFIARVQIVSMTKDDNNRGYHTAEIKVLELFKGESRNTFSVYSGSGLGGDCGIWTEPGSEWLIVANKPNELVAISYCSGSEQLLPAGSLVTSFDERRLRMYRTLKTKLPNPDFLDSRKINYNITKGALDKFIGLSMPEETIALYLATFDIEGKIKKIQSLHEFKNRTVSIQLKLVLEKQLFLGSFSGEEEKDPLNRQRLVAIYYKSPSRGRPGSFSRLD